MMGNEEEEQQKDKIKASCSPFLSIFYNPHVPPSQLNFQESIHLHLYMHVCVCVCVCVCVEAF